MEYVSIAIAVALMLAGLGIVIDQLLRLRKWLKNSPPNGQVPKPPERTD
jgi:hypothetical protein